MSAIIKVHISTCPECGTNEWYMEAPDEVARKPGVQRVEEETPPQAFRRAAALGFFFSGWMGLLALVWKPLGHNELPTSDTSLTCANRGHEMNLAQTKASPRPVQNWPLT